MGLLGWLFGLAPGVGALEKISGSLPSPVLRLKSSSDAQAGPAQWLDALEMASIALRCKNTVIEQLHQRLVQAEQQCDAATHAAAAGAAVTAAETQLALARCRELEQRLRVAAAEQQRAVRSALHQARSGDPSAAQARLEVELDRERAAAAKARLELVTAKQQRAVIRQQVAALQAELTEARQAQAAAAATAAQLDAGFASLRDENEELQALLTQRESAYLTLLETVQELFKQHSPGDRADGASGEASPVRGDDVAARLQGKLEEWQARLESAAKLRSTEGAAAQADGKRSVVAGGRGEESGDGAAGLRAAHASQVLAAIEAAAGERCGEGGGDAVAGCDDVVGTPGSGSPASTTVHGSATQGWQRSLPASPRIAAVRQASASAAASPTKTPQRGPPGVPTRLSSPLGQQLEKQSQVWRDNPLAASSAGSRIKQLGLQAAGSPAQQARPLQAKPQSASSAAASPVRGRASPGKPQAKPQPASSAASSPVRGRASPGKPQAKPQPASGAAASPVWGRASPGKPQAKPQPASSAAASPVRGRASPGKPQAKPQPASGAAASPVRGRASPAKPQAARLRGQARIE